MDPLWRGEAMITGNVMCPSPNTGFVAIAAGRYPQSGIEGGWFDCGVGKQLLWAM